MIAKIGEDIKTIVVTNLMLNTIYAMENDKHPILIKNIVEKINNALIFSEYSFFIVFMIFSVIEVIVAGKNNKNPNRPVPIFTSNRRLFISLLSVISTPSSGGICKNENIASFAFVIVSPTYSLYFGARGGCISAQWWIKDQCGWLC